jgi:hypothetical protein
MKFTHNYGMRIDLFDPTDKIKKPVSTLAIVPSSGAITRVARQAYTIMLMLAKEQGAEDAKTGLFSAPVNTIIKGFNGNIGTKVRLKADLKSMVSHVVEWQSPSEGEITEWGALPLLAEVRLKLQGGEHWVHWAYPPSLRQEMLHPQIFAKLNRLTISKFRSHAGLALYEICARYQDNPSHLTSKRAWKWWVPVLTGKPLAEDSKVEFRFFNRDTVKPAVEEINEVSELIVETKEIRVGKSIEYLQFSVRKKPTEQLGHLAPLDGSGLAKAEKLGIPNAIAEELWLRHGNADFLAALNKLAQRLSQIASPIRSKVAYLKAVLTTRGLDNEPVQIEITVAKEVQRPAEPNSNPADVSQRLLLESSKSRTALVRGEILALSDIARDVLLQEYKAFAIAASKHPRIIKKAESGEWQSGILLGELMAFYWKKTRGLSWSVEQ